MTEGEWPDESGTGRIRSLRPAQFAPSKPRLNLPDALSVLWFRKWSILAITLLTVGVALFVSSRQTPIYESQANVLVTPIDTGSDAVAPPEPNLATEAELVSSVAVAQIVAENLGTEADPRRLLQDLSVDQLTDTEILEVRFKDAKPAEGQRLATGFAEAYLQFREDVASREILEKAQELEAQIVSLEQRLKKIDAQLLRVPDDDPRRSSLETEAASLRDLILQAQIGRLNLPREVSGGRIIQPAALPSAPVSPDYRVNVAIGLVAGLGLGIGLAFVRDRISGRLRSSEEFEEYLEAPILGVIPRTPEWRRRKKAYLVSAVHWRSPPAEAYRVLRTNLLTATAALEAKSIVVTSAHSGEGKSATVANLGVVLARAGKRVTLVSADLRRPRLHEFFRRDGKVGLSDVLAGRVRLRAAVQDVALPWSAPMDLSTTGLRLLPSGGVPENPAELLTSETMARVLSDLEQNSDVVLIDVPPILPVTDAPVVAAVAKNVLLVIGPNSGTRASVVGSRQQLERVGAQVLGGVLNGPNAVKAQPFGYY